MEYKILIIPVNYNSYRQLNDFIQSCASAFENVQSYCKLIIRIADNSTETSNVNLIIPNSINIKIHKNKNLGYLGGAFNVLNSLASLAEYDYIIISNVDIKLGEKFFLNLLNTDYSEKIGWIAPMIYSKQERRDKNPKILKRYTKNRLKILRLLYRYPILHKLYIASLYQRKHLRSTFTAQEIYAGHGSLMIFRGAALEKIKPLNYPVFLFGEECFMAEKLRVNGYKVFYDPAIEVIDDEHTSTGNMKSDFYYQCNEKAIKYLISEFYE